jgi:DNA-binding NtrC family response regulator
MTGYASDNSLNEAGELEVADFLYKPFNIEILLESVNRILGE